MSSSVSKKKKLEQIKEKNPFISSTELVYRLILDDIVQHRLKPGQKLNQEQIADELDMSRTPVRDALNMLERDGFLSKGAQGYTVYIIKVGDYMALLDLRIAIETLATRLACARIRTSEMKKIEENLSRSVSLLEEGSRSAWDEDFNITNQKRCEEVIHALGLMDQEFHRMIINASHNRYLVETYEGLTPRIHFFRYTAMDVNCCLNMVDRHKMIYEAITMRDENLAEQRMRTHLQLTVSRAMRY